MGTLRSIRQTKKVILYQDSVQHVMYIVCMTSRVYSVSVCSKEKNATSFPLPLVISYIHLVCLFSGCCVVHNCFTQTLQNEIPFM